jgi:hypothetical protein
MKALPRAARKVIRNTIDWNLMNNYGYLLE